MGKRGAVWKRELALLGITAVFLGSLSWMARETEPEPAVSGTALIEPVVPKEAAPEKLDANTASAAELEYLPGVGETLARRIVDWREKNGPFRGLEDLLEVRGIGEKTLEELGEYLTVNGGEGT